MSTKHLRRKPVLIISRAGRFRFSISEQAKGIRVAYEIGRIGDRINMDYVIIPWGRVYNMLKRKDKPDD